MDENEQKLPEISGGENKTKVEEIKTDALENNAQNEAVVDKEINDTDNTAEKEKKPQKDVLEEIDKENAEAVSYTHLTLPTTPYV